MRKLVIVGLALLLALTFGCNYKPSYFGVKSRASVVPAEIAQTEAAIQRAEQSSGAQYCPEKLAQAKELAREGVETYWACRTADAMAKLAEARRLAQEAEGCQPPPPPPAAPPPPPPPPPKTIILEGVLFAFDSYKLTPEAQAILDQQALILQENPDITVEVAGHTCNIGTDVYNQKLSENRAGAVANYLTDKGVASHRLTVAGYGEARPIDTNDTEQGRSRNRRVELQIQ